MPNYLEYQKSVAAEFKAYECRVRNLIDSANWAEEGRYKEIILMNYLKRILPQNISVGTGFVRSGGQITKQIDIIIYDNTYPLLFSADDFIVACGESVLGFIEVKTDIAPGKIVEYINKACFNEAVIRDTVRQPRFTFNGIFSYNLRSDIERYYDRLSEVTYLKEDDNSFKYSVNHICLGSNYFIKLWGGRLERNRVNEQPRYSIYKMTQGNSGLAFAYFFSNLLEDVYIANNNFMYGIPTELSNLLYPIAEGKEITKIRDIDINP
jgi:hypothetical protein